MEILLKILLVLLFTSVAVAIFVVVNLHMAVKSYERSVADYCNAAGGTWIHQSIFLPDYDCIFD